jgi:hypothetical protein
MSKKVSSSTLFFGSVELMMKVHPSLVERRDPGTAESTRAWCQRPIWAPSSGALTGARIRPFYQGFLLPMNVIVAIAKDSWYPYLIFPTNLLNS